jgi:hypothetical protein
MPWLEFVALLLEGTGNRLLFVEDGEAARFQHMVKMFMSS